MMDEAFINSFADEDIDGPTTYTPPPVSPEEEAELDKVIDSEIRPVALKFRAEHAGNLDSVVESRWHRYLAVPFSELSEADAAAVFLKLETSFSEPHGKRLLVNLWRSIQDAQILVPWRKFAYSAIQRLCKGAVANQQIASEFAYRWFAEETDSICDEKYRDCIRVIVAAAEDFGNRFPVQYMQIPFLDRGRVEKLIRQYAPENEDLAMSLARLADRAKKMGFPVLTGISAAITYFTNPDLAKEMM